jgi:hypothetical protein
LNQFFFLPLKFKQIFVRFSSSRRVGCSMTDPKVSKRLFYIAEWGLSTFMEEPHTRLLSTARLLQSSDITLAINYKAISIHWLKHLLLQCNISSLMEAMYPETSELSIIVGNDAEHQETTTIVPHDLQCVLSWSWTNQLIVLDYLKRWFHLISPAMEVKYL